MGLTEENMMEQLPFFVTDPSNKAMVEALLSGKKNEALSGNATRKLGY